METKVFYLRPHFAETISGFFMVLGLLLVWTFIKKKDTVFASKTSRRLAGGTLAGLVTMIGMTVGLAIETGHSWGNPAYGFALGMQHPYRLFTNDDGLMVIGILYVVFQFIGMILAFAVYVVFVWGYNFFTKEPEKHIEVTKIFKWEREGTFKVVIIDAFATLIVIFTVLGASNFAKLPKAWPDNNVSILSTQLMAGVATALAISILGERCILTLNPFAWASAFVIKFMSSLYLDRKSIKVKTLVREFASPVVVFGVGVVCGLLVALILSLPHTPVPE